MTNIILGVKVSPGPLKRCKLENYNLHDKVTVLKEEAAKTIGLQIENIEVIYHGKILKDDSTLFEHGVKTGEMIHILKKRSTEEISPPSTENEMTVEQLISMIRFFGSVASSPAWTQAHQIANDPALMDEIISAVPELENDPVSLSILHEPELISLLRNSCLTRKLNTEKPHLIAGVKKLIQLIKRQLSSTRSSNAQNTTASGYAYSLEALSEDEDEDDEELDDHNLLMENSGGITNQQLANALRIATRATNAARGGLNALNRARGGSDILQFLQNLQGESNTANAEGTSSAQSGNASGRPIITPHMFSSALTQAMSTVTSPNNANSNASRSSTPNSATAQPAEIPMSVDPPTNDGSYDNQLQTMREMGLTNERLNIRALLLSDGDVMAAVNLVFSGAIEDGAIEI